MRTTVKCALLNINGDKSEVRQGKQLKGRRPTTVSYTHLDVYKRQVQPVNFTLRIKLSYLSIQ